MGDGAELVKKLQIKPGTRLWLIEVPEAIAAALAASTAIEIVAAGAACNGVIAFAETPAEASKFTQQALKALPEDGLLWFAYRKGKAGQVSGLTRDSGWSALNDAGWETVRSISIDEVWTGLRFRPSALVRR